MITQDSDQTIPTYTDTLHVYSTVEGMSSQLTQSGLRSPAPPTAPDTPPEPTFFQALLQHIPSLSHPHWSSPKTTFLQSPGYLSYRHDKEGSYFIQTLVDVFTNMKGPILELLTEVSWDKVPGAATQPELSLFQTFLHFPLPCFQPQIQSRSQHRN